MSVRDDLKKKLEDAKVTGMGYALLVSYIIGCIWVYSGFPENGGWGPTLISGIIGGIPWVLPNNNIFQEFFTGLLVLSLPSHPSDSRQKNISQVVIWGTIYFTIASILMLINTINIWYIIGHTIIIWFAMLILGSYLSLDDLVQVKDEEEAEKRRREDEDEQRRKQLAQAEKRNAREKIEKKERLLRQHGGYLPCEWCGKEVPESRILCRDYGSLEDYFCSLKCLREFEDDLRLPRFPY